MRLPRLLILGTLISLWISSCKRETVPVTAEHRSYEKKEEQKHAEEPDLPRARALDSAALLGEIHLLIAGDAFWQEHGLIQSSFLSAAYAHPGLLWDADYLDSAMDLLKACMAT